VSSREETGTAIVELVWLALLLIVPLLYVVIAVFDTQRTAYAASVAARSASRAFVTAPDQHTGYARARLAARLAFADQGVDHPHLLGDQLSSLAGRLPDARIGRLRARRVGRRAAADAARAGPEHPADHRRRGAPVALRPLPRGAAMTRKGSQGGSITPLVVGFAVVVALLVAVVVDASAAYLQRQGLDAVADAAALAATDGIEGEQVYLQGLGSRAEIDPASARRYVVDYLRASGVRDRFPGLRCSVDTRGRTVVVRVAAPLRLPLHVPGVGRLALVRGTAAGVVAVSG